MGNHEKKQDGKFSKAIVISAVIAVTVYVVAVFYLEWHNANASIPDALTAAWFGFWTVELVSLASIRKTKVKASSETYESEDDYEQS